METDSITNISRFGRLRKISTKLIDLPMRSPHTKKHKPSKRRRSSLSSTQNDLQPKSKPDAKVDPFVDFRPEMFDGLLVSDESTETSSSIGDNDESGVMCERSTGMITKKFSEKDKVFSYSCFPLQKPVTDFSFNRQSISPVNVDVTRDDRGIQHIHTGLRKLGRK